MIPTASTSATTDTTSTATAGTGVRRARTPAQRAAGIAGAAILAGAFAIHAYWAAGGRWGAAIAYGSPDLPPQAATAVVAVLIAAAALVLLARVGVLATPVPDRLLRIGTWTLVAVFAVAAANNLIQPQGTYARDWHVYFFGPLLLILAGLCATAASYKRPR